jgi:hypothetical protein
MVSQDSGAGEVTVSESNVVYGQCGFYPYISSGPLMPDEDTIEVPARAEGGIDGDWDAFDRGGADGEGNSSDRVRGDVPKLGPIKCGDYHNLVTVDGHLAAWGAGVLGNSTEFYESKIFRIPDMDNVSSYGCRGNTRYFNLTQLGNSARQVKTMGILCRQKEAQAG